MPTSNNGARARSVQHLADAYGSMRELSLGLGVVADGLEGGSEAAREWRQKASSIESLCVQLRGLQSDLHDILGHGRLDELTEVK